MSLKIDWWQQATVIINQCGWSWFEVHPIEIQVVLVIFAQDVVLLRRRRQFLTIERVCSILLLLLRLQVAIFQLFFRDETCISNLIPSLGEISCKLIRIEGGIEIHPEFDEYMVEIVILLLHLLVVAATLLGLSTLDETSHGLEDLIGSAQVFEDEMAVVYLQEEVILPAFLLTPVALLDVLALPFSDLTFGNCSPRGLFAVLLFAELDVAFLSEQRLEVVPRNDLLLRLGRRVGIGGHCWLGQGMAGQMGGGSGGREGRIEGSGLLAALVVLFGGLLGHAELR